MDSIEEMMDLMVYGKVLTEEIDISADSTKYSGTGVYVVINGKEKFLPILYKKKLFSFNKSDVYKFINKGGVLVVQDCIDTTVRNKNDILGLFYDGINMYLVLKTKNDEDYIGYIVGGKDF